LGGESISLNCCKWLQINRLFFRLLLIYPRAETGLIGGHRGGRGAGERGARDSSFILHPSSFFDGGSNPSSACKLRSKLKGAIETARAQVAELVGVQPRDQS
jgi:hypothetical protein